MSATNAAAYRRIWVASLGVLLMSSRLDFRASISVRLPSYPGKHRKHLSAAPENSAVAPTSN